MVQLHTDGLTLHVSILKIQIMFWLKITDSFQPAVLEKAVHCMQEVIMVKLLETHLKTVPMMGPVMVQYYTLQVMEYILKGIPLKTSLQLMKFQFTL